MTKKEHFPLSHKQARTFGLSKSDKALQKLLGQCANNTQRIQLLVEALDLARDEGAAAWQRLTPGSRGIIEKAILKEREACAKLADATPFVCCSGCNTSFNIAAAIRARGGK